MTLPGMKSTADFAADERPKTWRETLLRLSPRNGAPLYGLTSQMKAERTTDPEFKWWEEDLEMYELKLGADLDATAGIDAITLADRGDNQGAGGTRLKPGDFLKAGLTGEVMRVMTITSDTAITVERALGPNDSPAGTAAAIDFDAAPDNDMLIYIGSAYREGAPRSIGTSFNPVQRSNVTQIFRTPVEMTRTAQQTTYRTGNAWANDRLRAMHKHALGIERAFWFGTRYETQEAGQPLRTTGGALSFIPASNIQAVGGGGELTMLMLEDYLERIFAYGSGEKLAFGSLRVQMLLNRLVRKNTSFQWGNREKEYGMDVTRFYSPAGTLVLTEHPGFSASRYLRNDMFVLDTANFRYRHLQDTTFRDNIQENGVDGKAAEFLTEAGLEVWYGKTHFWLRGLNSVAADPVPAP